MANTRDTGIKVLFFLTVLAGCRQGGSPEPSTAGPSAGRDPTMQQMPAEYSRKLDTLTVGETTFLERLAEQDPSLIWTKQVERVFGKDSSIVLSKLVFPENFLTDSGYRSFELSGKGLLTNADITYFFDRGQADMGYGSVIGYDTAHFTHTFRGCGLTNCITVVYDRDKKISEVKE